MSCKTETWRYDPNYLLRRCDSDNGIDFDVLPQDAPEEARTRNLAAMVDWPTNVSVDDWNG